MHLEVEKLLSITTVNVEALLMGYSVSHTLLWSQHTSHSKAPLLSLGLGAAGKVAVDMDRTYDGSLSSKLRQIAAMNIPYTPPEWRDKFPHQWKTTSMTQIISIGKWKFL